MLGRAPDKRKQRVRQGFLRRMKDFHGSVLAACGRLIRYGGSLLWARCLLRGVNSLKYGERDNDDETTRRQAEREVTE